MRFLSRWELGAAIALLAVCLMAVFAPPAKADGIVPGYAVVRLRGGSIADIAVTYHSTVLDSVQDGARFTLAVPAGMKQSDFVNQLNKDKRVQYAETDTFVLSPLVKGNPANHPVAFDGGGGLNAYVNQTAYRMVDLGNAQALSTGTGVTVAVIDTGATFDHPALAGHYLPGYNTLAPGSLPLDVPDGVTNIAVGHGTMIAGIIARIVPGASILPIRVMNADGVGTLFDVAKAIHFAVQHGARVLNMSFGTVDNPNAMSDALDEAELAGCVLVASGGNLGTNQVQFPAARKGALAVAALNADYTKSPYSSYGSYIKVDAPGTGILSTFWNGGYASWSGTSFAAPFVAGEAALILGRNPSLTNIAVSDLIRGTALPVDIYNKSYKGGLGRGIIDIFAAVRSL